MNRCSCPPCRVSIKNGKVVLVTPSGAVALCAACEAWIESTIVAANPRKEKS